jgi:site-specific recombinase XerD
MSTEIITTSRRQLSRLGLVTLPATIMHAGEGASRRFIEFFTANIRNKNTRMAYSRALVPFFAWCEQRGLNLHNIQPVTVAAYIEQHTGSKPTVKQHLAAIRMLFDWLVVGQIVPMNPASSVRGPKYVVRALIGVMVYSFARVSAVVGMRIEDYYQNGKRWWIRLHEKGGKRHEVPAHHNAEAYLDAYLMAAGIAGEKKSPLFRTINKHRQLTDKPMYREDVLRMIKRRAEDAGLPATTCCHTFRATGITAYLENGGTIENAQAIAAHESPRTTKLYDRTSDEITLDEVERILI